MANKNYHNITKQFVQAVDFLIKEDIVKNDREFCLKIGLDTPSLSQMRGGKRNVTIELLSKVYSIFHVNPYFLIIGKEPVLINSEVINSEMRAEEPRGEYSNLLDHFKSISESQRHLLDIYKEENERLRNQLHNKLEGD